MVLSDSKRDLLFDELEKTDLSYEHDSFVDFISISDTPDVFSLCGGEKYGSAIQVDWSKMINEDSDSDDSDDDSDDVDDDLDVIIDDPEDFESNEDSDESDESDAVVEEAEESCSESASEGKKGEDTVEKLDEEEPIYNCTIGNAESTILFELDSQNNIVYDLGIRDNYIFHVSNKYDVISIVKISGYRRVFSAIRKSDKKHVMITITLEVSPSIVLPDGVKYGHPGYKKLNRIPREIFMHKALEGEEGFAQLIEWAPLSLRSYIMVTEKYYNADPKHVSCGNRYMIRDMLKSLIEINLRLYSFGLIHRDLAPANIVLDPYTLKFVLIDFESMTVRRDNFHDCGGHVHYNSPEKNIMDGTNRDGSGYGLPSEVFSIGAIAFDWYKFPDSDGMNKNNLSEYVKKNMRKPKLRKNKPIVDFIISTTKDKPDRRESMEYLLDHPLFDEEYAFSEEEYTDYEFILQCIRMFK